MSKELRFIHGDSYTKEVQKKFASSRSLLAAIAFWGADAEFLLAERQPSPEIRLICNLGSGACNPYVIKLLLDRKFNIRSFDSLHAKVLVSEEAAIIGSANLSANGLSVEGGSARGWAEAGVATSDPSARQSAIDWFDTIWSKATRITPEALADAKEKWNSRRKALRSTSGDELLSELSRSELEGRAVYAAIYRESASDEAFTAMEKIRGAADVGGGEVDVQKLDFWEDWAELPTDSTLISVYYGPRGGVTVEGAYVRVPELDGPTKAGTRLQVVVKQSAVLGREFSGKQMQSLQTAIKANVEKAWGRKPANADAVFLPLDVAIHGERGE